MSPIEFGGIFIPAAPEGLETPQVREDAYQQSRGQPRNFVQPLDPVLHLSSVIIRQPEASEEPHKCQARCLANFFLCPPE